MRKVPVIVGVGQITDTTSSPDRARSPKELMVDVARLALSDSGAASRLLPILDSVAVLRTFSDSSPRFRSPFGRLQNAPRSVAAALGSAARDLVYTSSGGNMPQVLVARACELIASGEARAAIILGAEALRTQQAAVRAGMELDWSEDADDEPQQVGVMRAAASDIEQRHGLQAPIQGYPLFENALRRHRGRSISGHQAAIGNLWELFSAVAKENPLATRRKGYSADEIANTTGDNRFIGFPYTRLMNANVYVDQAAALVLTSTEEADRLGIPREQRVFLHGHAEAFDRWHVTDRLDFHSSPAIRAVVRAALDQSARSLAGMSLLDIYSCFPSAVEIACAEIGLPEDDPRGLTVTGGLPFFGGPGNNYVTHAIAEMVKQLRRRPGAFGLVTANGNYLTKHAAGVYSTSPPAETWSAIHQDALQGALDAAPGPRLDPAPQGAAELETYTVLFKGTEPVRVIAIGRTETDARFIANTPDDRALFDALMTVDRPSWRGTVSSQSGQNVFVPAGR